MHANLPHSSLVTLARFSLSLSLSISKHKQTHHVSLIDSMTTLLDTYHSLALHCARGIQRTHTVSHGHDAVPTQPTNTHNTYIHTNTYIYIHIHTHTYTTRRIHMPSFAFVSSRYMYTRHQGGEHSVQSRTRTHTLTISVCSFTHKKPPQNTTPSTYISKCCQSLLSILVRKPRE